LKRDLRGRRGEEKSVMGDEVEEEEEEKRREKESEAVSGEELS
jgi:hypothetical protein